MFIINPGSGPVTNATLDDARANMRALRADLGWDTPIRRNPSADDGGRYGFLLTSALGREHTVEMPGIPLERVRWTDEPGQNIWGFPRLYVNGESWIWAFALGVLAGNDDEEDIDPMTEQERDQLAQVIYEQIGVRAGYAGKPWHRLRDWEKFRYVKAATAAVETRNQQTAIAAAERIVTGRAA